MSEVRLIDANALKEDFKTRLEKAKNWKENALNNSDDELVIRATATIDFICEVIMTINNAPTIEIPNYGGQVVPDALQGWRYEERPQGEWKHIVEEDNDVECPFCGFQEDGIYYNFCPSCGARLKCGAENE